MIRYYELWHCNRPSRKFLVLAINKHVAHKKLAEAQAFGYHSVTGRWVKDEHEINELSRKLRIVD